MKEPASLPYVWSACCDPVRTFAGADVATRPRGMKEYASKSASVPEVSPASPVLELPSESIAMNASISKELELCASPESPVADGEYQNGGPLCTSRYRSGSPCSVRRASFPVFKDGYRKSLKPPHATAWLGSGGTLRRSFTTYAPARKRTAAIAVNNAYGCVRNQSI